ncbi:hypothetical protein MTO96_003285 [Rhipicephalus appendiculatus]
MRLAARRDPHQRLVLPWNDAIAAVIVAARTRAMPGAETFCSVAASGRSSKLRLFVAALARKFNGERRRRKNLPE